MTGKNIKFEFVNRMDAQRQVLDFVNSFAFLDEKLFGLTKLSVERWGAKNKFPKKDKIVNLLSELSQVLSFLASESQQQISKKYSDISNEFYKVFDVLKSEMNRI